MLKLLGYIAVVGALTAAVSIAIIKPSPALDLNVTFGPYLREAVPPPPDARVIHIPRDESPEAIARRRLWLRVCQPRVWIGGDGVGRYVYGPDCPDGVVVNRWMEVSDDD